MYTILEKAELLLTLEDGGMGKAGEEDEDLDFRYFEKLAFVDGEYTFLFDSSLENIAGDAPPEYKGVPLEVRDWFIPSYEEPAHPYLWVDDVPHSEEPQCSEYRPGQVNDELIVAKVASGY